MRNAGLPGDLARLSPDGQWIAYQSDETGRQDVYVSPFPDVAGTRYQISEDGGGDPVWLGYDIHPHDGTLVLVRPVDPLQGREIVWTFQWRSELHPPER